MNAQLPTDDETRIRALIEGRVAAAATKDSGTLAAGYADDVVLYDVVGPLRHTGAEAHTRRVAEWLALYDGGIGYWIRDLHITVGEDVAFCHYLYQVSGTTTGGTDVRMWVRSTVCLRRTDGSWRITHEHTSVPFDGETGAASLDLQP